MIDKYLGCRWVAYASGEGNWYDCWGLAWAILRDEYGVNLSRFRGIDVNDFSGFNRCAFKVVNDESFKEVAPINGTIVLMSRHKMFHHVGIWHDGSVIHTTQATGSCLESIDKLRARGFSNFKYLTHDSLL